MPEKTPKPKKIDVSALKTGNPRGVESVYANNASVSFSPWDIRFVFSEIGAKDGMPINELRANVVMTPAHTKALLQALERCVAGFEKEHGEIVWPPKSIARAKASGR